MPSPEQIHQQVVRLTAALVGLSVCNHQNFPSLRDLGCGVKEIGLGVKSDLSIALKNARLLFRRRGDFPSKCNLQ